MTYKTAMVWGILMASVPAFAMNMNTYKEVMNAVRANDLKALRKMVRAGVNLNDPLPNGATPLCVTVAQKNYRGYEMLVSQGASPSVPCMKQIPQKQLADFYANQPPAGTYYKGTFAWARYVAQENFAIKGAPLPFLNSGEVILGGIAAGAALAVGGSAMAGGGGGGSDDGGDEGGDTGDIPGDGNGGGSGGGSGGVTGGGAGTGTGGGSAPDEEKPNTQKNFAAPLNLIPDEVAQGFGSKYDTTYDKEFMGYNTRGVGVLAGINAAWAYARGYTGYEIKRNTDGTLQETGSGAIDTNKSVIVGVVDTGAWTEHPGLKNQLLVGKEAIAENLRKAGKTEAAEALLAESTFQQNFAYGVCSESNNGKCWGKSENDSGDAVLYGLFDSYVDYQTADAALKKDDYITYYNLVKEVNYYFDEEIWTEYNNHFGVNNVTGDTYVYNADAVNPVPYKTEDGEGYSYIDYDDHGSHVSGLIAADPNAEDAKMMGVAYNAKLVPFRVDFDAQKGIWESIPYAIMSGAEIINFSLNSDVLGDETVEWQIESADSYLEGDANILNAYREAVKNNTILVYAAGNESGLQSGYDSFLPQSKYLNGSESSKDDEGNTYNLKDLFVNVVSVDIKKGESEWTLASYSNQCGGTKEYCVAAPGGDNYYVEQDGDKSWFHPVYSTVVNGFDENQNPIYTYEGMDEYGGWEGTSMAAPVVTGALAVIKGAFPHLTNQQVVQILFRTATDLGEEGVDDVFGHGLINLDAATSPVGVPTIPLDETADKNTIIAAASNTLLPYTLSGVVKKLPKKMIVMDDYQRAFGMDTSDYVQVSERENKLENRFQSFMSGDEKVVAENDVMRMAYSDRHSDLSSDMPKGAVSFEFSATPKLGFKTYYSENTAANGGSYFDRLMLSPYAKMKEAWGGVMRYDLTKNWRASIQGQVGQNGFVDEEELKDMDHNRSSLFQSTLEYRGFKKMNLKLVAGVTNEQGAMLGMWGQGAFKTGNSKTQYVGAGMKLNLTDNFTVEGMYYTGVTKVSEANSLLGFSDVKSDSFAMTAAWKMTDARTFGLQLVSPLRVRSGVAMVNLPVARDAYENKVYHQLVAADLKPTAREYDIGLYYSDAFKENCLFQSEIGVRLNPDHMADAKPDWRALLGLSVGL